VNTNHNKGSRETSTINERLHKTKTGPPDVEKSLHSTFGEGRGITKNSAHLEDGLQNQKTSHQTPPGRPKGERRKGQTEGHQ